MPSYDAAWLAEYLRTHPAEAARMALSETVGAPHPTGPGAPAVGLEVAAEPEGVFMERLRRLAVDDLGYLYFHQYSAKRSTPGMTDCLICHPEGSPLFLWELKTASGVVSPAQRRWIDALHKVTGVDARIVRPSDWALMVEKLLRK